MDTKLTNINPIFLKGTPKALKKNNLGDDCDMDENIREIIDFSKQASSYKEIEDFINKKIENGDIEALDNITYRSGDYIIRDILKISGENEADTLKMLNDKKIGIAPKLVDAVHIEDYSLLFLKIDGLDNEDLKPFNECYQSLSKEAKQEAYNDIKNLLKMGLINNTMLSSSNWFVVPKTEKIIVPGWRNMRRVGYSENNDLLNQFHQILFRP